MLVNQQLTVAADPDLMPQVVASYAAYLYIRTHTAPVTTVTSDRAELGLTIRDKALVLAFECRNREWSLRRAEVRHGDQSAAFTRGELAAAVTALLEK